MTLALVPVETLKPGDAIDVSPRHGVHVVAELNRYPADDDGADVLVVVYFQHGIETYENRARDKGRRHVDAILGYRSLKPLRAGTLVTAERGSPDVAATLKAELESTELERQALAEDRQARSARWRERRGS